ncbi:MAG: hypothetical protein ACRC42_04615 [Mycoplasma sp.]
MENEVLLKIYTPQGLVFDDPIVSLATTTTKGQIGVYPNQPNLIAQLKPNIIKINTKDSETYWVVPDGIMQINPNLVVITTSCCLEKNQQSIEIVNHNISKLNDMLCGASDELAQKAINDLINVENIKINLLSK